jgi:hypothetical protein
MSAVERGVTDYSKPYLYLTFPREKQADQVLDVSFLFFLPNLEKPFLEGIRRYLSKLLPATRYTFLYSLRNGFVNYLKRHHRLAGLLDLDRSKLRSYLLWQDSTGASANGERALSQSTSIQRISAGRIVLEALRHDANWGIAASFVLKNYPKNTHKGSLENSTPRAILSRETLESIHHAALTEIEEIRARLAEGEQLLEQGKASLTAGQWDYSQFTIALAAMVERYPGVFPAGKQVLKDDHQLGRAVFVASWGDPKAHGILRIAHYRYASARDMVPFVLAVAIEGAYNSDTVLGLTTQGVQSRTILGVSVTAVEGRKGRAKDGTYGKDLDPKVVGPWFALVEQLTALLRSALPEDQRDRMFVYSPYTSAILAKAFSAQQGPSCDATWRHSLQSFCKRHGVPHFSLAQLRPTLLDQVGQRHGSLAASRAGQHQSFQTTDDHYLGPGTRERERERLGVTVQQFERFVCSDGKIDVRQSARPSNADKGAATPGFLCLQPYDSPIAGQRKNRLCRAFGACPACAMSVADVDDPVAVAYWLALERAIYRAREYLDPQHWLQRWAPVAARLLSLLQQVSESVSAEARLYTINLPPVG